MCFADDPTPKLNGELADDWMNCKTCVAVFRVKMETIRELAECRTRTTQSN